MLIKITIKLVANVLLVLGFALASNAQAAYTITIQQVGSNVVANGSGTINTAALHPTVLTITPSGVNPSIGQVSLGSGGIVQTYNGIGGPATIGPGGVFVLATSGTGNQVEVSGSTSEIAVPDAYVSGSPLTSTATWSGATLAGLGLTPGTYLWTWGSGATADSFTVNISAPAAPVPTFNQYGVAISVLGLLGSTFFMIRRKERF